MENIHRATSAASISISEEPSSITGVDSIRIHRVENGQIWKRIQLAPEDGVEFYYHLGHAWPLGSFLMGAFVEKRFDTPRLELQFVIHWEFDLLLQEVGDSI
jgi:hypothetical protein